uniref:Uncharacterized protein n=1 Tax=Spongospora subterranea TaxID=70186 RepID=A0A0H5R6N2_9EUKA|eukprot:CRZ03939.1 hypothetical protein [Spongospora subterranea]
MEYESPDLSRLDHFGSPNSRMESAISIMAVPVWHNARPGINTQTQEIDGAKSSDTTFVKGKNGQIFAKTMIISTKQCSPWPRCPSSSLQHHSNSDLSEGNDSICWWGHSLQTSSRTII